MDIAPSAQVRRRFVGENSFDAGIRCFAKWDFSTKEWENHFRFKNVGDRQPHAISTSADVIDSVQHFPGSRRCVKQPNAANQKQANMKTLSKVNRNQSATRLCFEQLGGK